MITVQLIGGLGNQLFQYAIAKSLSLEKKQKLAIDISGFEQYKLHDYALNHFDIKCKTVNKQRQLLKKIHKFFKITTYYKEKEFNFNYAIAKINTFNIYLKGYFQSEKYFKKYEAQIRKDFEIITPIKAITQKTIEEIESINSVSIHIRRGDYLQNHLHNTNKETYYLEAMYIIESKIENPVYYVFSDDIAWAKSNFKTNFETNYIDFNDASTNFEDLKLMSTCKHNIIANSSFSWWGAWLNTNINKIVIAPKIWFNDQNINSGDIIPENWIKI